MNSTLRSVEDACGRDKLIVMASAIDRLIEDQKNIQMDVGLDPEIETLELESLAERYGVSLRTLRGQIERELDYDAVFKCGKKWVIRKVTFLKFLKKRESGTDQPSL